MLVMFVFSLSSMLVVHAGLFELPLAGCELRQAYETARPLACKLCRAQFVPGPIEIISHIVEFLGLV